MVLRWSPGCVYWNSLRSIIKTMFYHFPSRLVTSYRPDHLTHLSCTRNSNWNSAIVTIQRKITFQSPKYIFFWFILLIFYLDQNPDSLVFSKHTFGLLPSLFLEMIFPFDILCVQPTTWSTASQAVPGTHSWAAWSISKTVYLQLGWPTA